MLNDDEMSELAEALDAACQQRDVGTQFGTRCPFGALVPYSLERPPAFAVLVYLQSFPESVDVSEAELRAFMEGFDRGEENGNSTPMGRLGVLFREKYP